MKCSTYLSAGLLVATFAITAKLPVATAFPQATRGNNAAGNPNWPEDLFQGQWKDGAGQERTPCPLLNTIANHGLVNYSGRDIPLDRLRFVLQDMMGLSGQLLEGLMKGAKSFAELRAKRRGLNDTNAMDYFDTITHGIVEHDVSLTRLRRSTADPERARPRNQEKINGFLAQAENGFITFNSVAVWRNIVLEQEKKETNPPPLDWELKSRILAAAEGVALLEAVGRDGKLSVEDTRIFLSQERFPPSFKPVAPASIPTSKIAAETLRMLRLTRFPPDINLTSLPSGVETFH